MPSTTCPSGGAVRRILMGMVIALVLLLIAGACGGSDSSDSSAKDLTRRETPAANTQPTKAPVIPPGAKVVKGTGYSFAMPKGWSNLTKSVRKNQPTVDVAVGSKVQTKGFTNNMNVVVTRTSGTSPEELKVIAEEIKDALADSAPDYEVRPATKVAGLTTVHLSGRRTDNKQTYWLEQFVVLGEKNAQVVSFSVSLDYPVAQRNRLIGSVLRSWSVPS